MKQKIQFIIKRQILLCVVFLLFFTNISYTFVFADTKNNIATHNYSIRDVNTSSVIQPLPFAYSNAEKKDDVITMSGNSYNDAIVFRMGYTGLSNGNTAEITYNLKGLYSSLSFFAGFYSGKQKNANLIITADSKEILSAPDISYVDIAKKYTVSVVGIHKLTIRFQSAGYDGAYYAIGNIKFEATKEIPEDTIRQSDSGFNSKQYYLQNTTIINDTFSMGGYSYSKGYLMKMGYNGLSTGNTAIVSFNFQNDCKSLHFDIAKYMNRTNEIYTKSATMTISADNKPLEEYTNKTLQWNDISYPVDIDLTNVSQLTISLTASGYDSVFWAIGNINIADQPHFPQGYNFYKDSYSFENYLLTQIPKGYFTTLYGKEKGTLLFDKKKYVAQEGVCYGMAVTTAAIYNNLPPVNTIAIQDSFMKFSNCNTIRDIKIGLLIQKTIGTLFSKQASRVIIGSNDITIDSYIKYAFLYQYSREYHDDSPVIYPPTMHFGDSNINSLFDLVKDLTDNDKLGLLIDFRQYATNEDGSFKLNGNGDYYTLGGHAVLAIGYQGNSILIDDPNNTDNWEKITIYSDGSWDYSGDKNYSSKNTAIRYSTTAFRKPYEIIKTGKTVTVSSSFIDANVIEMENLDQDEVLVYLSDNSLTLNNDPKARIAVSNNSNTKTNAKKDELYWVKDNQPIVIKNWQTDANVIVAGNDSSVSLATNYCDDAEISISKNYQESAMTLSGKKGTEYSLSFSSINNKDKNEIIHVKGTGTDNPIECSKNWNSITISGLDQLSLEYSIDSIVTDQMNLSGINTLDKYTIVIDNNKLTLKNALFFPGDVDGDEEITSGDARLALRASVQLEQYEPGSASFLAADVDGNGTIESSDARTILRVSVKLDSF